MDNFFKTIRDKVRSGEPTGDFEAGNRYNEEFDYFDFHAARFSFLFDLGRRYFTPGAKFLDVGSLFGYVCLGYQALGYQVFGTDLEKYVAPFAPQFKKWQIDNRASDLGSEPIPYPDQAFDLAMASEVLEHFRFHPLIFFREAGRVLKPGGRLIITTPNLIRLNNVIKMIIGRSINWDITDGYWDGAHAREFTAAELKLLARTSGLAIETVRYKNFPYPNLSAAVRIINQASGWLFPRRKGNLVIIFKKI
ncbi:MAG: class I SAM-dependent methyltransferase [Patescibacteria group bacterium]|jgi:SAM-dependent methyltransferase